MWHSADFFFLFVALYSGLLIVAWRRRDAKNVQLMAAWLIWSVCQVLVHAIPQWDTVFMSVGLVAMLAGTFCYFRNIQLFWFQHDRK
ncbi:MAG: hypothetical protein QM741_16155 [Rudaea sp.]|uniref:hypothetical protein n=1 Tax=Rudaea sp. TaxID=2136325 RepID=UPI0039E5AD75